MGRSDVAVVARGQAKRLLGRAPTARRYLKPGLDVDRFARLLNAEHVQYVFLRWWETLPAVEPGEDIDLLVANDDLERIESFLVPYPPVRMTQKVDLYTVSGLPGTDFHSLPYYPPAFAARILERAELFRERYKVPAPQDYFDSLAYHAAYHKGLASGLAESAAGPDRRPGPGRPADHDYRGTLEDLAAALSLDADVSLAGLDQYLNKAGITPPFDTLERYRAINPWLERQLVAARPEVDAALRGLTVFVVRELGHPYLAQIRSMLTLLGVEILHESHIDESHRDSFAEKTRGGNWGRGPWPRNGGKPAVLLFCNATRNGPDDDPWINAAATHAKLYIRTRILADVPAHEHFNPLHSSDNAWQSLEYAHDFGGEQLVATLRDRLIRATDTHDATQPAGTTLQQLSSGRRADVYSFRLPERDDRVILKRFKPGMGRFLEREVAGRSEAWAHVTPTGLIAHGPDWMLTEFIEDTKAHSRRKLIGTSEDQLTWEAARSLARCVLDLRGRDRYLLDLASHNVMSDGHGQLRILDLEFLGEYSAGSKPPLAEDFTALGWRPDATGDMPAMFVPPGVLLQRIYLTAFHPAVTGLPIERLVGADSWWLRQRARLTQDVWYLTFAVWGLAERVGAVEKLKTLASLRARLALHRARKVKR